MLDLVMDGMDGFEVCRRIKSDPVTTHIPILVVSGLDAPANRAGALNAGADAYMTKPPNPLPAQPRRNRSVKHAHGRPACRSPCGGGVRPRANRMVLFYHHPEASHCYAWEVDGQVTAQLGVPPVRSAVDTVRASTVAKEDAPEAG